MTIKPAPIIAIPNVPSTRATLKERPNDFGGVVMIVRRGKQRERWPTLYFRGDWT